MLYAKLLLLAKIKETSNGLFTLLHLKTSGSTLGNDVTKNNYMIIYNHLTF